MEDPYDISCELFSARLGKFPLLSSSISWKVNAQESFAETLTATRNIISPKVLEFQFSFTSNFTQYNYPLLPKKPAK